MGRLQMTLAGVDFTSAFNKWESVFSAIKVEGPNSGMSMGGSEIVDLIRVKDIWDLTGNPLKEDEYSRLLTICNQSYVTASYTHPETGESVTKIMIPTLSPAQRVPYKTGVWYVGWSLTLKER